MIVVNVAISLDSSSACSAPVRTVTSIAELGLDPLRRAARGVTPSAAATWHRVELALLVEQLCAVGMSKIANVAPPSELRSPYLRDADDRRTPVPARAPRRRSGRRPRGPRRRRRPRRPRPRRRRRPAPLDEVQRIEAVVLRRGLDPERERRRATGVDRLAVRLQQLRLEVLNRACRDLDTVDGPDMLERLLGDRRRLVPTRPRS